MEHAVVVLRLAWDPDKEPGPKFWNLPEMLDMVPDEAVVLGTFYEGPELPAGAPVDKWVETMASLGRRVDGEFHEEAPGSQVLHGSGADHASILYDVLHGAGLWPE